MKQLLFFYLLLLAITTSKAQTSVGGHITSNTIWNIAGSPYKITSQVIVDQGKTLTIKPGVTIQMPSAGSDGASIFVDGTLKAIGTADSVINFTNTGYAGGQTKRIVISSLSTNSVLQYATLNGLGYYYSSNYTPALILQSPTCQVKNCNIINSNGVAIELDNASTVSNNIITGSSYLDVYTSIDNLSKLSNNGTGLYVGLSGTSITKNQTLTKTYLYRLLDKMVIPQGKTLTIKPGVTIQMPSAGSDGASIFVDGTLKAIGTADSVINFTNTGYAGGQTKRIVISSLSTNSVLQYATLNGLGYYYSSNYTPALILQSPTCQVKNCNIINSNGVAIELDNASTVSNNIITGSSYLDVYTSIDNLSKLSNNGTGLYVGLSGTSITKNQTLTKTYLYRLLDKMVIPQGKTLTIKPGVTIQMPSAGSDGASIFVDGTLKAIGTADSVINFTNTGYAGGQTKRIVISSLSTNSVLQYATLNGLGYYYSSNYTPALILQSPTCQVKNCNIINSNGVAIELDNASTVSNNIITGSSYLDVYTSIDNLSKLSNNGTGLYVGLSGTSITKNQTLTKTYLYRLLDKMVIPQGKTLTIKPGVTIQMPSAGSDGASIFVDGTLKAIGTADSVINFTNTGYAGGQTKRIVISSLSTNSVLQYATLNGLGYYYSSNYTPALILQSPTCQVKNCNIINSNGVAIELDNASTVSNNIITGSSYLDVYTSIDNLSKLSNNGTGLYVGLSGTSITKNQTLTKTYLYRLLDKMVIPQGKTLTIKPGVTIQMPSAGGDGASIFVDGTLKAIGTVDSVINFTNTGYAGGQTKRIVISSLSTNSVLQYATLNGLGYYYSSNTTPGININTSTCSVKNCNIINTNGVGITLPANTNASISNNSFSGNSNGDILANATSISNLSGNKNASIYIPAATIQQNVNWSNPGNSSVYILNGTITVNESYKLTIAAGTTIDFQNNNGNLFIKGTLNAVGTKENRILFTKTENGYGGSISFDAVSKGSLIYVITNKLGTATSPGKGAAIELNSKYPITLRNDSIRNSEIIGLAIKKANPLISATNFTNNKNGVYSYTGTTVFNKCSFTGNNIYGIKNTSTVKADTVDARNCWWDDPSGPYQSKTNPTGLGDSVTLKVLYKPFAKKPIEPNDVGVIALITPASSCDLSGSEQIKVRIKNFGIEEQTGFNVSYKINNGKIVTENVGSLTIATDSTIDYVFTQMADFSATGKPYTVKAFTALASDTVLSDDTVTSVILNRKPNLGADTTAKVCKDGTFNLWTLYDTTGYKTKTWSAPNPAKVKTGTYTLVVTSNSGCADTASAKITSYILNTPTISASGNTTFCKGASITLTSSPAASYLWSTGAISRNIVVKQSGNYTVTTGNDSGCNATSAPTLVEVDSTAKPTITPTGSLNLCPNGSVKLTSSVENAYAWSTNAATQSITTSTPGSYTVTVTGLNGCKNTSDPAVVTQICDKTSNLKSTGATTKSVKLTWTPIDCGIGYSLEYRKTGTTNWTIITVPSSSYTLNGLTANTSYDWAVATICQSSPLIQSAYTTIAKFTTAASLSNSSIAEKENSTAKGSTLSATIYPVPVVNNAATLVIKNSNGKASVTLTDIMGKTIWLANDVADGKIVLPVNKIAAGTYIVNVYSGKENVTLKLLKQ